MNVAGLPNLRVRRAFGVQNGVIDGVRYVHNPRKHDALAVLDRATGRLLDAADGSTIDALVAKLSGDTLTEEALRSGAALLVRNGFVDVLGPQPSAAPWSVPTRAPARRFDLWVHVTNACNLRCPYCYIHKSADHLEEKAALRLLDTIEATAQSGRYDVIHARYAGGEPMLRLAAMKAFHTQAVQRCQRHGVTFSAAVLTNGTAVPGGAIEWLKAEKIGLSVSIDGTDQLQDTMRPTRAGRGSFRLLEAGLDQYHAAGISPFVLITVGPDNLEGLATLTDWLLQRGLAFRYSLVRDMEWGNQAFSADGILQGDALQEVIDTFAACYDLIERDLRARHSASADPTAPMPPPFRLSHRFCDLSPWRPIRKACGAGERFLALGHDGGVSPCQAALHDPEATTNVSALPGADLDAIARDHQPFGDFTRKAVNDTCSRCRHAPSCAGGCPLLLHRRDGAISGRSPYCEVFRYVLPRIVELAALEMVLIRRKTRGKKPATKVQ